VLLEITPRVGGDCLPQLVEHCSGLDTLGISLDLAEGGNITIPPMNTWSRLVAVRFFARRRGTVVSINTDMIQADSRVREVSLKFSVGHKVHLPPQDYASWMLGHAIFRPNDFDNVDEEAMQIADKLNIKMEPFHADRTDSHGQTAVDLNEAVDA